MRTDENGKRWFEKGDQVKPITVTRWNKETQQEELVPHPKPFGGIRVEDGEVVETKLPDTVSCVDEASGQFQLASWVSTAASDSKFMSWRTRWEPPEWYDIVKPKQVPQKTGGGKIRPTQT